MTKPSPFLAPTRPHDAGRRGDDRSEAGTSLAALVDAAAVAVVGLVLRWIDCAEDGDGQRAR